MHSLILLALASLALASDLSKRSMLLPRQGGDAFIPGSTPVSDCQYPCGEFDCLLPSRGDTCCSEGYACPGGSFCLTKGYCCPDGEDPTSCASQNGITLPSGFKPGQTVAADLSTSSAALVLPSSTPVAPSPSTTPASTTAAASTPTSVTPVTVSSATAPFPTPVTNATLPPPTTATGTGASGGGIVLFTGGAMRFAVDGAVAAVVLGAMCLLI